MSQKQPKLLFHPNFPKTKTPLLFRAQSRNRGVFILDKTIFLQKLIRQIRQLRALPFF